MKNKKEQTKEIRTTFLFLWLFGEKIIILNETKNNKRKTNL